MTADCALTGRTRVGGERGSVQDRKGHPAGRQQRLQQWRVRRPPQCQQRPAFPLHASGVLPLFPPLSRANAGGGRPPHRPPAPPPTVSGHHTPTYLCLTGRRRLQRGPSTRRPGERRPRPTPPHTPPRPWPVHPPPHAPALVMPLLPQQILRALHLGQPDAAGAAAARRHHCIAPGALRHGKGG